MFRRSGSETDLGDRLDKKLPRNFHASAQIGCASVQIMRATCVHTPHVRVIAVAPILLGPEEIAAPSPVLPLGVDSYQQPHRDHDAPKDLVPAGDGVQEHHRQDYRRHRLQGAAE